MKIIAGTDQHNLVSNLLKYVNLTEVKIKIITFSNKEYSVEILDEISREEVVILQSTSLSANDSLMELLLIVDAVKSCYASKIIVVMPYYLYSRQDKSRYNSKSASAKLVANLIEASGVDLLITFDLHAKHIAEFFNIKVININTLPLFIPFIQEIEKCLIISPDQGSWLRAKIVSEALSVNFHCLNKFRNIDGDCSLCDLNEEVKDMNCVIIDDIIDSGNTICRAAELLSHKGVKSIIACVTHGFFSGNSLEMIDQSCISQIFLSNTILPKKASAKMTLINTEALLASVITSC